MLLKKGADKECQDDFGITPLFVAAQYGKLESLSILISSGKLNLLAFALLRSSVLSVSSWEVQFWTKYKSGCEICGFMLVVNKSTYKLIYKPGY